MRYRTSAVRALSYRWREFNKKLTEISINICIVDGYLMPNKNIYTMHSLHTHLHAWNHMHLDICTVHSRKRKTKCK